MEVVGHFLVCENEPDNVHKGATREAVDDGTSHCSLQSSGVRLAPERFVGLIQRRVLSKPEVGKEMRIVRDVSERRALVASLLPKAPGFQKLRPRIELMTAGYCAAVKPRGRMAVAR